MARISSPGKLWRRSFIAAAVAACALCPSTSAEVIYQPAAPAVAALNPSSGSISGGTRVTITGANFASVNSVSFDQTPAVSFKVESETQITAVSPSSGKLGEVSVSVTTAAGSASGIFTYLGCLVPRLKGLKLKRAKALLRNAGCGVGAVKTLKGKKPMAGRVVAQSPRPGTVLGLGTRVSLTVR